MNLHQDFLQHFCYNNHLFVLIPPPIAFFICDDYAYTTPGFCPPVPLM